MSELEDLYQDIIVDHFQNPRCFGCMKDKDAGAKLFNPLCGDQINLCVKIEDDKIKKIVFSGKGCSISQAAASMMCELLEGKSISEAKELFELYQKMLKGEKQCVIGLDYSVSLKHKIKTKNNKLIANYYYKRYIHLHKMFTKINYCDIIRISQ